MLYENNFIKMPDVFFKKNYKFITFMQYVIRYISHLFLGWDKIYIII